MTLDSFKALPKPVDFQNRTPISKDVLQQLVLTARGSRFPLITPRKLRLIQFIFTSSKKKFGDGHMHGSIRVRVCIYNPNFSPDHHPPFPTALLAYSTLIHELKHVSDSIEGLEFTRVSRNPISNRLVKLPWAVRPQEIRAVEFENEVMANLMKCETIAISNLADEYRRLRLTNG